MELTKNNLIQPDDISHILTLRYNPNLESQLNMSTWKDFREIPSSNYEQNVSTLLEKYIKKKLDSKKNLVIAMGGGVDSTLLLSFLKKTIPEVSITGLTISFSSSEDESPYASQISKHFEINHKVVLFAISI